MNTNIAPTDTVVAAPTIPTTTPTPIVDVTATVDDVELLNILGLTSFNANANAISCNNQDDLAVLDWNDMPELSAEEEEDEEEDEDDKQSISSNNKRKSNDQGEDLFAQLDFVEVPLLKKQKTFVDEEDESELLSLNMDLLPPLDDEIRLALDLISSA
ncbi:hypothetical protein INT46_002992 [Mucor plumbeus]|uniref:Uncharacterized protein n=1 Tax=Mucor plumbeus TaxID=97098 RepID=A0A8H7QL08_9FUNG|nr:hypothetical protein INT46_002992 [Mucor plumbeus]